MFIIIVVYAKADYFVFYEIPVEKDEVGKERRGKLMESLKLGDLLSMVCYSAPTSSITEDIDM